MIIRRESANPNKWTFTIPPIKELIERYVGDGTNWIDPFAGMNSPAEYANDLNPEAKAKYHLLADEFCKMMRDRTFNGVIFDPPYSYRQITECYKNFGFKATALDTSNNFYNRVMNQICDSIKMGGLAISFGWNTNGFGLNRGFSVIEILIVNHGQHHNDTLVTVERRIM